ncbi:hypothetical protein [Aeromicrobium camelliae]|uniref:hypothetical protein n=1 Tax=Aeromicrobium camelliae TaxID=1538144 RepID=UPI00140D1901|nr:hypothetical protein [Aeromicrobium camelliae]
MHTVDDLPPTHEAAVAPSPPGSGVWRALAVVAVAAAAAAHAWVARGARHPSFPFDEIMMLQMSWSISGGEPPYVVGAGYYPGWSFVMAPLWWITDDPMVVYRAAIWLGVVVSLVTILPLGRVIERFGLTRPQAVVVASIVVALPARAIQSDYLLSERLLFLFVVLSALAVMRVTERPTVFRAVAVSAALAFTLFTHARVLPVLLAAAIWMGLFAVRHRRVGIAGLVSLVAFGVVTHYGTRALIVTLLGKEFTQDEHLGELLASVTSSSVSQAALGQAWYQLVASFGAIALGVVVLVAVVWRELVVQRVRAGWGTYLFGTTTAIFLVSSLRWADPWWREENPWVRLDVWVYGRYIDPFAALVVALGVAALVAGLRLRTLGVSLGVSAAVVVPTVLWVAPQAPTWGFVTPAHIPGILPWTWLLPDHDWARDVWVWPTLVNENRFWLVASLAVLVALAIAAGVRRHPRVVATAALAVAVASTVVANRASDVFHDEQGRSPEGLEVVDRLRALDEDLVIGFDKTCPERPRSARPSSENYLGYYMLPSTVHFFAPPDEPIVGDVVIACETWELGAQAGARRIEGFSYPFSRLWVMPGALQNELDERGLLDDAGQ